MCPDVVYEVKPSAHGCKILWRKGTRKGEPKNGTWLHIHAASASVKEDLDEEVDYQVGKPIVLRGLMSGTDYMVTITGPGLNESATFRTHGDPPRSGPRDRSPPPVSPSRRAGGKPRGPAG